LQQVFHLVDILLPNEREACKLAGTDDLETAVRELSERVPLVVVKLGRDGAMAVRGKERVIVPAQPVIPVDTVGAGDSFDAGFLHQYVRGEDLATCLTSGNLAGAFSTTRPGGTEAFREPEEWNKFLQNRSRGI
jgi:sugar/nucleoside kinase (ribokinase family)